MLLLFLGTPLMCAFGSIRYVRVTFVLYFGCATFAPIGPSRHPSAIKPSWPCVSLFLKVKAADYVLSFWKSDSLCLSLSCFSVFCHMRRGNQKWSKKHWNLIDRNDLVSGDPCIIIERLLRLDDKICKFPLAEPPSRWSQLLVRRKSSFDARELLSSPTAASRSPPNLPNVFQNPCRVIWSDSSNVLFLKQQKHAPRLFKMCVCMGSSAVFPLHFRLFNRSVRSWRRPPKQNDETA